MFPSTFFYNFVMDILTPGKFGLLLGTGAAIGIATGCISSILSHQTELSNDEFEKYMDNLWMAEIINRLENIQSTLEEYNKRTLSHLETSEIFGRGRKVRHMISQETQTNIAFFNQSKINSKRIFHQTDRKKITSVRGKFSRPVIQKTQNADPFVLQRFHRRTGKSKSIEKNSELSCEKFVHERFSKTPYKKNFSFGENLIAGNYHESSKVLSNSSIFSDPSGNPVAYSTLLENPVRIALNSPLNLKKILSRDSTIYLSDVSKESPNLGKKKSWKILKEIRKLLTYRNKYKKPKKEKKITSSDSTLMSTNESSSLKIPKIRITQH